MSASVVTDLRGSWQSFYIPEPLPSVTDRQVVLCSRLYPTQAVGSQAVVDVTNEGSSMTSQVCGGCAHRRVRTGSLRLLESFVTASSSNEPTLAGDFAPKPDRSYLLYCPELGGWHVGLWCTLIDPGRWVLAFDTMVELYPSHVVAAPGDPMNVSARTQWAWTRQATLGSA